ncbi:MAG: alpha/beta hydrolase [Myxococcota bacterium]
MPARHRILVALVLGLGTAAPGCNNRLFLHPSHDPVATAAERVEIGTMHRRLEGRPLEAFYREYGTQGRPPGVFVLAFTGNAGRAERLVDAVPRVLSPWNEQGMAVLAVNYPGFGSMPEPGPANLRRLGVAAEEAYAYAVERAAGAPIVIYGISMGTTAALHIAASHPEQPPAGLVLDRGPNIPRIVMGRFGWWNLWLAAGPVTLSLPRSVWSRGNARRIDDVPAVFVLGTTDTLVTPRNGGSVIAKYDAPHRVVQLDIGHNTSVTADEHPGLVEGLTWLWTQVDAGPPGAR